MDDTSYDPFGLWIEAHPIGTFSPEVQRKIRQWLDVSHGMLGSFGQFYDRIEPWLDDTSSAEPDLVGFISGYGYSRAMTGDWTELPIEIPADQVKNWEQHSSVVGSMEQLHDYQAGLAGTVAEILHRRLREAVGLINKQLDELYDELDALVAKPIDSFTPTQWGKEDIGEEETGWEIEELDRIFDVYEKLWCFEQGIEELRMLMISEDDPEFHLPSQTFYDALMSINSHKLISTLDRAEPKLRDVLKSWSNTIMTYSGKPYHRPYDHNAPDVFWWRHRSNQARPSSTPRKPQGNRGSSPRHRPTPQ